MRLFIKKYIVFALAISPIFLTACKKEGIGGNAEISFTVEHHEQIIPHAKVYIKYGAKEFPGAVTTAYDDSVQTDASSHGHFADLIKGDYYIYGIGYDSAVSSIVKGGVGFTLKAKDELTGRLAVTE